MKIIREICQDPNIECKKYTLRKAARALLFNDADEIAILHVAKHNYHKLPGGGIESGEDIPTALMREIKEETGAEAEIMKEHGTIIEYKNSTHTLQISYCFIAKTKGVLGKPQFTELEKSEEFALQWHSIDDAINLIKHDTPEVYHGKYIVERDLAFLLEYQKA